MERELIIRAVDNDVDIALLEDKRLVELHRESDDNAWRVSDIYLARIKRLNPGMNAAFVEIGHPRDAFLHYTDLGPNIKSLVKFTNMAIQGSPHVRHLDKFRYEPEIVKTGKINNALAKKNNVLVQVLKEPISTKGPRLTCEITLPGRYVVLAPFQNSVGISRRIADAAERKRLVNIIESIKPKNFGVVIRTNSVGATTAELHQDIQNLLKKWEMIIDRLKDAEPVTKILGESSRAKSLLRDMLNDSFSKIIVNDKEMYLDIKGYIDKISPDQARIVTHFTSRTPIFDAFGVTRQIKSLFGKNVTMSSGAYLVIEHTEALHVVDVNSGQKMNNDIDQEANALNINLESAEEIARQLRLRDVGGIIVIDFIDMRSPANKKELVTKMREFMKPDIARHTILPMSKFGIVQITRQRVRPELSISTSENCPACKGTGKVGPSVLLLDEIERDLIQLKSQEQLKEIQLHVHSFVYAYLKRTKSKMREWKRLTKKRIRLSENDDYHLLEYHLFDKQDEEITFE